MTDIERGFDHHNDINLVWLIIIIVIIIIICCGFFKF